MAHVPPLTVLRVPDRTPPASGAFDLRPRQVAEWIQALPLASVGETARRVFHALQDINRLEARPTERFGALEQFREPLRFADDALSRHYAHQSHPLSPKQRKIAELCRALQLEMATGYKIVTLDSAGTPNPDPQLLATAVQRALRYLTGVLLRSYRAYTPAPIGVWREIHALHELAEVHGVQGTSVPDSEYHAVSTGTPRDAYQRVLLLAAACPYRLRQGEHARLDTLLEGWAGSARLGAVGSARAAGGSGFVVDPDADQPPTYLRAVPAGDLDTCRALDTRALVTQLQHEMERLQEQPAQPARRDPLDLGMLRRLAPVWGLISKRSFTRTTQASDAPVIIGLHAVHHGLCKTGGHDVTGAVPRCGLAPGAIVDTRARFTSKVLPDRVGETPDVWDMVYERVDPKRGSAAVTVMLTPSPDELERTTPVWRMKNLSAGGCCLLWGHGPSQVLVGELVAVGHQSPGCALRWNVGVIRWMLAQGPDGLEIGIQLLSPGAQAGALRVTAHPRTAQPHHRALYLPGIQPVRQPPSLITAPGVHAIEDTLTLVTATGEARIRLTGLLEDTGLFAQFLFDPEETGVPRDRTGSDTDFESLWPIL
ncbi:MAG: hypothetical protein B7Z66_00690 [Chromatiales bacterium 21-64-14]|nr:MAG: hypothetical protein B7Z66_00690 [Chromatiales bacterium 21-64-14]HQU15548.1 hypothetical protein [Gammaproteobacteria bacterium]